MSKIIINKLFGEDKSARVGKIFVKTGDQIKAGDELFNAESAKGNYLVKSEHEGKILEILIKEGQQIKIGDAAIEIDGVKACIKTEKAKSAYSFGLAQPKKENICCDLVVVGGGPGGYVAAIRAAQLGADVVLIEKHKIGGTCLNYGCIPTKSLVKSAHLFDEILRSEEFGIHVQHAKIDLLKIVERKDKVVSELSSGIKYLLGKSNIRLIEGEAKTSPEGGIFVKNAKIEAQISARNIIIATGSSPAILQIPGADLPIVLTSEEILSISSVPESLAIIGGGVIGMEFAFIFNSFGSKVTVIEYMDDILFNFDEDIIEVIVQECSDRGIRLITGARVDEIDLSDDGKGIVAFTKNESRCYAIGDRVLMAVGRKANLSALDTEALGVSLNERGNGIKVDLHMRTSNPSVFAIGDVTNKLQLAHVASHQGIVAAENCMGLESSMKYDVIPSAVFVSPEIGVTGLCEREAKKSGIAYKVTKFPFSANGKALSQGETKGFVKILSSEEDHTILGAAVIGPGATDLISNFTPLIMQKTDYRTLSHTIVAHPTTAESVHEAILGIEGGAIHFA